jgi:hypothetical protein
MKNKETLEEVAERLNPYVLNGRTPFKEGFMACIKWQQERSYSEEEVEILLETLSKVLVYQGNDYRLPHYFEYEIKQVIKQFKKK